MKKPFVYIASPYTKGDPAINTGFQCRIFEDLMNTGLVYPYAPLWSHFQHTYYPRPYQDWINYDLAIIERMDACLRLNATGPNGYRQCESSGADGEVQLFEEQGKPVFYTVNNLISWARQYRHDAKVGRAKLTAREASILSRLRASAAQLGKDVSYGPHVSGQGFYAAVLDPTSKSSSWEQSSHGETQEEALTNARIRLIRGPERLYQPWEFGV